jgi:hypothetical protein
MIFKIVAKLKQSESGGYNAALYATERILQILMTG